MVCDPAKAEGIKPIAAKVMKHHKKVEKTKVEKAEKADKIEKPEQAPIAHARHGKPGLKNDGFFAWGAKPAW